MGLLCAGALILLAVGAAQAGRSLLPKPLFYVAGTTVGEVKFWAMYLGNHEINLVRKFPGEDQKPIKTSMNLSLVSSGYVEGNGYSSKGKIGCSASLMIGPASAARKITLDSIDYVYDYGAKVKLRSGEVGDLLVDAEGELVTPKAPSLRLYEMTKQYGEEILTEGKEIPIVGFAFSKEAAQKAAKEPVSPGPGDAPAAQ
jgi:hypothetical protein